MNDSIFVEIRFFSTLMRKMLDSLESDSGCKAITGLHFLIICYIKERGGKVCQKDIYQQLKVKRSSATGVLQLMEKNGLIIRANCDNDSRNKEITLTSEADEIYQRVNNRKQQIEQQLVKGISDDKLSELLDIIKIMEKNIQEIDR